MVGSYTHVYRNNVFVEFFLEAERILNLSEMMVSPNFIDADVVTQE